MEPIDREEFPPSDSATAEGSQQPLVTPTPMDTGNPEPIASKPPRPRMREVILRGLAAGTILSATFGTGLGSGYLLWGNTPSQRQVVAPSAREPIPTPAFVPSAAHHAPLPTSYTLKTTFGDIGPQLIKAGAFDDAAFADVYHAAGQPLTAAQRSILTEGSNESISFDAENSYFLLNLFWALGLTNQNSILSEGMMVTNSGGQIERFASTGGWTLATVPIAELYASTPIVELTVEQQALVEEVAAAAYRPCCNNHTAFPDCNHGMAMLGMLQLMAAQGADVDEMFEAAKYANAFWFPQQSQEIAMLLKVTEGKTYDEADARMLVSANYASGSGYAGIRQWLANTGHLEQPNQGGNSCGV
jgi:hypothetical protein